MHSLISAVSELKKSKIRRLIRSRMRELSRNFSSEEKIFSELCFCLLTANERAAKGIEIQKKIGNGFLTFSEKGLRAFLKKHGYRFYNVRAKYIVEARKHLGKLKRALAKLKTQNTKRDWLVQNVKGLGYKEASHLLRNLGFLDVAILDRHIIKLMHECGMIDKLPKTPGKKRYLEYERMLKKISDRLKMKLGELDFYLWYMETGKILK